MTYYLNSARSALLLVFSLHTFSCFASERVQKYPDLIMHGKHYSNACAPASQKMLRNKLSVSGVRAAKQAWKAVNAILCLPNDTQNRAYVKQALQTRVRMSLESTGETPDVRTVERNDELVNDILAAGRAWKANIRVESGKILLQYFASEACVEAVTLSFENGNWSVYEFGVACD